MTAPSPDSISIPKQSIRRAGLIVGAVVAITVVVLLTLLIAHQVTESDTLGNAINSHEYQSVVLTNGQIYFGKLSSPGDNYYYLRHVYYLTEQATRAGGPKQRALAPIVKDIHAPEDMMVLNRSQIVYMENLKPTGEVSRRLAAARS
jgi:hypothetical protein